MCSAEAPRYRPKSREQIARNMSAIRSTDNKTESALRSKLHCMGFRFRKYRRDLPGKPDIVFASARVAVFVDGDYWHGRLLLESGPEAVMTRMKSPNKEYWLAKFRRNVARDEAVTRELQDRGWVVLRFWEGDIKSDVTAAAEFVATFVRGQGQQGTGL